MSFVIHDSATVIRASGVFHGELFRGVVLRRGHGYWASADSAYILRGNCPRCVIVDYQILRKDNARQPSSSSTHRRRWATIHHTDHTEGHQS